MKILHVTAHLGGGVGKAHAALCAASDPAIERHYVLLERPRDTRFAEQLQATGATITLAPDANGIAHLARAADIVQIEWWNHPRLYEALCRTEFPAMRTVFWCHISGLFAPYVPAALYDAANRFVFTSPCSLKTPQIAGLGDAVKRRLGAIGSGFGFDIIPDRASAAANPGRIAYLGTLDFVKMSPMFFDVIDAVDAPAFAVSLWGAFEPDGAVVQAARRMRHPARVRFEGHARDPARVLSEVGIFLYLLQPEHYGTAENALVEAMSLGCVPLAFANPAETTIIDHGTTGFTDIDAAAAARRLEWMLANPQALAGLGAQAMAVTARTRTPALSATAFQSVYEAVLGEDKRVLRFSDLLGSTPADWFLTTQVRDTVEQNDVARLLRSFSASGAEAKGSLAHFSACFPGDPSLAG